MTRRILIHSPATNRSLGGNASDRHANKAGRPYTDNVRPIPLAELQRILAAGPRAMSLRTRATAPSGWSLLRVSSAAGIAIAVFCTVYFAGQLAVAAVS